MLLRIKTLKKTFKFPYFLKQYILLYSFYNLNPFNSLNIKYHLPNIFTHIHKCLTIFLQALSLNKYLFEQT